MKIMISLKQKWLEGNYYGFYSMPECLGSLCRWQGKLPHVWVGESEDNQEKLTEFTILQVWLLCHV